MSSSKINPIKIDSGLAVIVDCSATHDTDIILQWFDAVVGLQEGRPAHYKSHSVSSQKVHFWMTHPNLEWLCESRWVKLKVAAAVVAAWLHYLCQLHCDQMANTEVNQRVTGPVAGEWRMHSTWLEWDWYKCNVSFGHVYCILLLVVRAADSLVQTSSAWGYSALK